MKKGKRVLCALAALLLVIAGLCAVVVAYMVIAWPVTNPPQGKADNWLIATPYLIATVVFFAASAIVIWIGFLRPGSSPAKGER